MHRCIELAKLGAGNVAPNPMVGAVLVFEGKIIGEGYHQKYGEAHAEPNAIGQAIENGQADRIPESTLYVSLEPCAHFGKTPPCADLIIKNKIPKVVIGCRDPFVEVNGKGVEKLIAAGINVEVGILEKECRELNKRFMIFHQQHRPYIILKWAQTADGFIAYSRQERLLITNDFTNRLVHKWRSEEASILVGTNTAMMDDPQLTTRLWAGNHPVRLVIDMDLKLPGNLKLLDGSIETIVFNKIKHEEKGAVKYYQVTEDVSLVHQMLNGLHQMKIQSVIVEGGTRLIQSFIDEDLWDEARIIKNLELRIKNGMSAPSLENAKKVSEEKIFTDQIEIFKRG